MGQKLRPLHMRPGEGEEIENYPVTLYMYTYTSLYLSFLSSKVTVMYIIPETTCPIISIKSIRPVDITIINPCILYCHDETMSLHLHVVATKAC